MPHYYLGQLTWRTRPFGSWGLPGGGGLRLDFRPRQGREAKGGPAIGYGFFELPERMRDESGYDYLGNDLSASVTLGGRTSWQQRLGLSFVPAATTLRDLLWEVMTVHADPSGADRHGPLTPGRDGFLKLSPTGVRKKCIPTDPEWPAVQDRLQRDYRRLRERVLQGKAPTGLHRKYLTGLLEKFGFKEADRRAFIPSDLPDELPLPRETQHTDDFDGADNEIVAGVDLTWTNVSGQSENASNQARNFLSTAVARAEADVSTDDHYAELDATALAGDGSFNGVVCRFDDVGHTGYVFYLTITSGQDETQLYKVVSGSYTQLGSSQPQTFSLPDRIRVYTEGSDIEGWLNLSVLHEETDTDITGNTRGGFDMFGATQGITVDNYLIADIEVETGLTFKPYWDRGTVLLGGGV